MVQRVLSLMVTAVLVSCAAPQDRERSAGASEQQGPVAVISDLESSIPDLMRNARIPGLQIALIRDAEVVWEEGFGITSSESSNPVTADTIFEAASLTKPVFAYAVMQMVDGGLVDLDRPVVAYLLPDEVASFLGHPSNADGFRADWFETITARQVLSHSAGMPHGEGGAIYPLAFEPGTDWKYSAEGYQLLQLAVERLAGAPLNEIIANTVLGPLEMEKSSMVWREAYEATMANGHGLYGEATDFRRRSEPMAAASLYTTAGDYARFVCAVINGERLQPATAKEMLTSFIDMSDDGRLGWSLGFGLQQDEQGEAFWQWGDYGIFRSYILAYPEARTGVVYLTNSFNGLAVCSDLVAASVGGDALGCIELEYQPHDGPFYAFLWDVRDNGADAVAEQLPEVVAAHPDIFTVDQISDMGQTLEGEDMYGEAIAFHRFNLERHPNSGRMMSNLAQAHLLADDPGRARELYNASLSAEEDPAEPEKIDWIMDYIQAMEEPAQLDEAFLRTIAGDYGPRHLRVRDGRLYYSRDSTDISAQRPLRAVSSDTFVLEGVTYFKLRVVLDDTGAPIKLVGMYEGGRTDESERD